ncbi:MAG: hypothetical protein NC110_03115 [Ruminococcus sp.]|nr:hypothetical protein [Ruminococcus sp.]
MPTINIKIRNKIAVCQKRYVISSNSNYSIEFDFDEEWKDEVKTVRYFFDSKCVDMVFTGNVVGIPKIPACSSFGVGIFTDKLSSTVAEIGCIISAADSDCEHAFEFSQSQYDQIIELLNQTDLRQIKNIGRSGNIVTVEYNNNTTDSFELNDGIGIKNAQVNAGGELVLTLTDDTELKCGFVSGKRGDWVLLNTVTLSENVDEVTISKTAGGKPFSVDEISIVADFKACSETTANTNVTYRESRLPKTPLSVQGILENALRPNADVSKICYMKSSGLGNCFSVHSPKTLGGFGSVAASEVVDKTIKGIAGITFSAAASTGRIGAGTKFTIYGRE